MSLAVASNPARGAEPAACGRDVTGPWWVGARRPGARLHGSREHDSREQGSPAFAALARGVTCSALLLVPWVVPPAVLAAEPACRVRSGAERVPLVELYTSEGCSSCPPADRWLSRQVAAGGQGAHWLAFHVDYWDDLGWPDRFAAPAHAARQRARVAAAGKRAVYTPQVMVGTQTAAMWRTRGPFARSLDAGRGPARAGLALRLDRQAEDGPHLSVGGVLTGPSRPAHAPGHAPALWVAETRDGLGTDVRAGENAGTRLEHDRVVMRLWGPWSLQPAPVAQRIALDSRMPAPGTAWTAFVQAEDGEVLQSLRLQADGCD